MEVVLVRHTSVAVPKGTCYGWSDVPLAPTFEAEAEVTKGALRGLRFDKVFSSPLTRARKLAEYCGYADAVIDDRLKEMNMGDWEMKPFDEISDGNLQRWYDDFMHFSTTNGEGFPDMYRRVSSFLDELGGHPYERVAVFAHGGVLMCAGIYGGLYGRGEAVGNLVPYGGIVRVTI